MRLVDLLELYDNWNGRVRINNESLEPLVKGRNKIFEVVDEIYNPKSKLAYLIDKEVLSFGCYDNTLCVCVR